MLVRSLNARIGFYTGLSIVALASIHAADPTPGPAATVDQKLFDGMKWRQVGPFRGGRALAIEGVPGEPNTYYFGAVAGGGWRKVGGGGESRARFYKETNLL